MLNRPEVFNSFNREMALLLQNELDACEKNPEVRAIVLTGSGKAFCAGQDLKEVTSPEVNPGFKKIPDVLVVGSVGMHFWYSPMQATFF